MKGAFYTAKYNKHGKLIPRVAKTNNKPQRNVAGESSSSNTNKNNNVPNEAESRTSDNTSNNDNNNIHNTAEKVEPNRALTLEDNYCVIYVWVPRDQHGRHVGSTTSMSRGCDLILMPDAIDNNPSLAVEGKIYLKRNGEYISRYRGNIFRASLRTGNFGDPDIDLSNLEQKLSDRAFRNSVFGIISRRGHTLFVRSSVGHVSIKTKDFYGSFWPDWEVEAEGKTSLGGKKTITGGELIDSYDWDKINEQDGQGNSREADFKIVLYSLDVEHMKKAFDKFGTRKGSYTWSLSGRGAISTVMMADNNGHSCASFVYDLLYHGGLFKKLNYNIDLARDVFVVNPNNMLELAVNAKHDELKRHPQTANYKKPFNTAVTVPTLDEIKPQVIAGGYCAVM